MKFLYFLVIIFFTTSDLLGQTIWEQADSAYRQGEKAQTLSERQKSFNQALNLYLQAEEQYQPKYGNGKLYLNIGNTFFQLEEYPQAILYYYRAQTLLPRNRQVDHNLNLALSKQGVSESSPSTGMWSYLFFFHNFISLPERLQLFGILTLLLLFGISFYVWKRQYKKWIYILVAIWLLILFSIAYSRFFAPIEGVITHTTLLYRDAGREYAPVSEKPIRAGIKVKILNVLDKGEWLKVVTNTGEVGYLPYENLTIIN